MNIGPCLFREERTRALTCLGCFVMEGSVGRKSRRPRRPSYQSSGDRWTEHSGCSGYGGGQVRHICVKLLSVERKKQPRESTVVVHCSMGGKRRQVLPVLGNTGSGEAAVDPDLNCPLTLVP